MATRNGKEDVNLHPTSSDIDAMPGSAGEREMRKFRPSLAYYRGTALAVMGDGGQPLMSESEALLGELLYETRMLRLGMILAGTCEDVDGLSDQADV